MSHFLGYILEGDGKTTCEFAKGAADPAFNNPPPFCKRKFKTSI